jgi:L-threonylcarbamoyladenylate synthase
LITKHYKIDRKNIETASAILSEAGETIRNGGLVVFPTETVYGLGANALREEASKKIYRAKGRPSDNPLIIHIANLKDLPTIAKEIPNAAYLLAKKFWPGPLTMIFNKSKDVPDTTTGGLSSVAVRMPDDEIALGVIRCGGGFVAAPSANTSGRPSPTKACHVADDLDGKVDMIIDGGDCTIGLESTILDMTVSPFAILRPGAITAEMLEEVIKEKVTSSSGKALKEDTAPKAPGMKYRHYSPKAKLVLIAGEVGKVADYINERIGEALSDGGVNGDCIGIIASEEIANRYSEELRRAGSNLESTDLQKRVIVKTIGNRADASGIAANLYRILREFDAEDVSVIYSEVFPEEGIGIAIMNRLTKAAGYEIIYV